LVIRNIKGIQGAMENSTPKRRDKIITEEEAAAFLSNGMTLGLGGFINCSHPMPIVRAIIRRGIKDLTIVGPASSGLDLDLLVGAGCVKKIVSSYFGAETITPISPMIKYAAEQGELDIFECDEGMYYAGLRAGAQRLPFMPTRAGVGTSYPEVNPELKVFSDPIKNETLIAVPAIRPEVVFLYAGYSDPYGNVQHVGTSYGDRALYRAADKTIVFAEKLVSNEAIRKEPLKTSIPMADGIVRSPFGAHPFSSPGFYLVDKEHLREYLAVTRAYTKEGDRKPFEQYLQKYIYEPLNQLEYLELIGIKRLLSLYEF
jgi:glutaconate CoA-transferase subunit A